MPEPRKRLRRIEDRRARFVTFSTSQRLPLFDNDTIKDRFAARLAETRDRTGCQLFAWVLMPEHAHLVFRPTDGPLATVLNTLKASFAKEILGRWRELDAPVLDRLIDSRGANRFWQHGGGYDRNLRDKVVLREKVDYIHANPVRRGLVTKPTDWGWSSARWYAGDRLGPVPIDPIPG